MTHAQFACCASDVSVRSEIDELTSRTFFDVVGNDQPSVVLFHELEESTSQASAALSLSTLATQCDSIQEFRWSYEEIYDHFMKKVTPYASASIMPV